MDAAFCARCGAGLRPRHDGGRVRPTCDRCGFVAYRNPTPVALVLARDEGRLLLARRKCDPLRGFWAPPAGYVEIDESVEDAAVREAREETGVEVALEGLRGVYSAAGLGIVIVAYHGRVSGGVPRAGAEVEEVGLFAPHDLPAQPRAHSGSALDAWFHACLEDLLRGET